MVVVVVVAVVAAVEGEGASTDRIRRHFHAGKAGVFSSVIGGTVFTERKSASSCVAVVFLRNVNCARTEVTVDVSTLIVTSSVPCAAVTHVKLQDTRAAASLLHIF